MLSCVSSVLPKRISLLCRQESLGVRCLLTTPVFHRETQSEDDAWEEHIPKEWRAAYKKHLKDTNPIKNRPFVKDLFVGRFNAYVLAYPRLRSRQEYDDLCEMISPVEKYFKDSVDSKQIDIDAKIPDSTYQDLKTLGLFGLQIPEEYGGLGLNATEYARLAEITALDGAISVTLAAHQAIGLKGILIAGTEEQKKYYLPKLATGEHVAAFCLTEPTSGSDAASIETRARLSADGKTYLLSGGKIWITNGGIADIFTVFAKTEFKDKWGNTRDEVTAFIVERAFGGITNGQPEDKLGIRGSNTCEVHFDNTPVPVENVLGEVGGGFKIAMDILNGGRFSMGSSAAGALKRLISQALEHAVTRKQFGKTLSEFGIIKEKFARMSAQVYAMESMAYLTAGIIDRYQEPDASLEAAIVKIYSSEASWSCVNECLQILGGLGYMKTYPYERALRDARILHIFEGTNEILRMFVALNGLKYLRNVVKDKSLISKIFLYLNTTFKTSMLKNTEKVPLYAVPISFKAEQMALNAHVNHFGIVCLLTLVTYKKRVIDEQMQLKRLADIAIDLYAMTATLSRAAKAIEYKTQHCDQEKLLCKVFFREARQRVVANFEGFHRCRKQFNLGFKEDSNTDILCTKIAEKMFEEGGHTATHPLELHER